MQRHYLGLLEVYAGCQDSVLQRYCQGLQLRNDFLLSMFAADLVVILPLYYQRYIKVVALLQCDQILPCLLD